MGKRKGGSLDVGNGWKKFEGISKVNIVILIFLVISGFVYATTVITNTQIEIGNVTIDENWVTTRYLNVTNTTYATGLSGATIVVAANNSKNKGGADYVCDGTADDVQIQAAIGALPTMEGVQRGKIMLLEGTYNIASTIKIQGDLLIEGAGIDATKLKLANSVNSNMFEYDKNTTQYFFSLKEMTLHGNKAGNSVGTGIRIGTGTGSLYDVFLHHLFIKNFADDGINIDDLWGYLLDSIIVEYNDGNGITVAVEQAGLKIYNSKIITNGGHGIDLNGSYRAIIANNELDGGNNSYGLYVHGNSQYNRITNCIIQGGGNSSEGIRINGTGNLIMGCYINGGSEQLYGINIVSGSDNQIIGNIISNTVTANIKDDGTNTKFSNNKGYMTEKGLAEGFTGDGSNTSFTFFHQLADTPTIILITPANDDMQNRSGEYYVTGVNATSFTLTFKTAPASTYHHLYWYAKID
jgi:hypothetical protein